MTDRIQDTIPRTWVAIDIAKRVHVVLVELHRLVGLTLLL